MSASVRRITVSGRECARAPEERSLGLAAARDAPSSAPNQAMISRANRLRDSKEFRRIARFGRKHRTASVVISATKAQFDQDRFGFVVPKRVGNAVQRNLAKRRLRAVCFQLVETPLGLDVVLRAEKPILDLSFEQLRSEVVQGVQTLEGKIK